jgi:hypothetical protein
MPFPANRSWRTTSALPRCRRNLSRSQSSRPSSSLGRSGDLNGFTPPAATMLPSYNMGWKSSVERAKRPFGGREYRI